jgi:hypothetical protein
MNHLLWHGNAEKPIERLNDLILELSLIERIRPQSEESR